MFWLKEFKKEIIKKKQNLDTLLFFSFFLFLYYSVIIEFKSNRFIATTKLKLPPPTHDYYYLLKV